MMLPDKTDEDIAPPSGNDRTSSLAPSDLQDDDSSSVGMLPADGPSVVVSCEQRQYDSDKVNGSGNHVLPQRPVPASHPLAPRRAQEAAGGRFNGELAESVAFPELTMSTAAVLAPEKNLGKISFRSPLSGDSNHNGNGSIDTDNHNHGDDNDNDNNGNDNNNSSHNNNHNSDCSRTSHKKNRENDGFALPSELLKDYCKRGNGGCAIVPEMWHGDDAFARETKAGGKNGFAIAPEAWHGDDGFARATEALNAIEKVRVRDIWTPASAVPLPFSGIGVSTSRLVK